MNTSLIISLLAAFGLGSMLTVVVQSWLARQAHQEDRSFDERKQAYIGLLEAYHRAAVERTDAAAKEFAYWQMRCDLVAPKSVRKAIERIVSTNDNQQERIVAHEQLEEALRDDLGISRHE